MTRYLLPSIAVLALLKAPATFSQGPLTPPGPPAPTMKSLDQIYSNIDDSKDPRVPIKAGSPGIETRFNGGFTIRAAGSYYLTENLSVTSGSAIEILQDGVTVDLGGFTITSTSGAPSGHGVLISANNVRVLNGHVLSGTTYSGGKEPWGGGGFQYGIRAYAGEDSSGFDYRLDNIIIHSVTVTGCSVDGISVRLESSTVVENCLTKTIRGRGIAAGVIKNSSAQSCGQTAISGSIVENCIGQSYNGRGITATIISNSVGSSDGRDSINHGIHGNQIQNCSGFANEGDGIHSFGSVTQSKGTSIGGNGIKAETVSHSIGMARNTGDDGIHAEIVSFSKGQTQNTSTSSNGIRADRAIACIATGGENIGIKYQMP